MFNSESLEVAALVDWEDSCVAPYVVDVAVCLSACCFDKCNKLIETRFDAILRAYLATRQISNEERSTIPDFMWAGALACGYYRLIEFHVRKPDSPASAKATFEIMRDRVEKMEQMDLRPLLQLSTRSKV